MSPRYSYNHSTSGVCAITGGAFYAPGTLQFPSEYQNDYFFADYCAGWIRKLDPAAGNSVVTFATGISSPVDLKVGDDGALYYLARGGGGTGVPHYVYGQRTEHHDAADEPHRRAWRVGHVQRAGFRAGAAALPVAAQRHEHRRSHGAGLHLRCCRSGQRRPLPCHRQQRLRQRDEQRSDADRDVEPGALRHDHAAGGRNALQRRKCHQLCRHATDPEDGTLPASAFTWQVDFHHDTHSHPFIPATSGSRTGSFTVPTTGHTETNVWYRIYLTVRDSAGQTQTTFRDVLPRKVNLTIATVPAGLQLRLDAQPMATPLTFESVVGIVRNLEAPATQVSGSTTYEFVSWSDGGAAVHNVTTPAANTTYTATYRAVTGGAGNGLSVTYFNNVDFTGTTVTGVDPTVDFSWGAGSPAAAIANDTFSARWTGQVQAPVTGTYTFYTQSDDGVRLWVNNQQLVNNWTDHGSTENSGTIALTAGQRYDIRMEFYENGGDAVARLLWSSGASLPKAVVPSSAAVRCGSAGHRHTRQLPAVRRSRAVRISCGHGSRLCRSWQRAKLRLECRQLGADSRSQCRELGRSAIRHVEPPAKAGGTGCGVGDCRAQRNVRGARGVWRRERLRQRVPDDGRGCADGHWYADDNHALDRGDVNGHRDRRPAHHPQRRGGEQ